MKEKFEIFDKFKIFEAGVENECEAKINDWDCTMVENLHLENSMHNVKNIGYGDKYFPLESVIKME